MKAGKKNRSRKNNAGSQPVSAARSHSAGIALQKAYGESTKTIRNMEATAAKYVGGRRYLEAIGIYQQLAQIQPEHYSHINNIGNVLALMGDYESAKRAFQHAIQLAPAEVDACSNLANIYNANGDLDQAESLYQSVLKIKPNHLEAIAGIAAVLEKRGEYASAYGYLKPLLDVADPHATVVATFSSIARHLSKEKEAIKLINSYLKKHKEPSHYRVALKFGLGDLYERIRDYDSAFHSITQGAIFRGNTYDKKEAERLVDEIIATFSKDFFAAAPCADNDSEKPVFIVGMPRSGTTLTEQIISSHPEIYGAGELVDLPNIINGIQGYPGSVGQLDASALSHFSSIYLSCLDQHSSTAKRVTDKLPVNFLNLGMIQLLFPAARVVHCTRNPLDTCLSCYFQLFTHANEFTYDLASLGHFYSLYQKLMTHWKSVLSIKLYEQSYENLVHKQQEASRRLIDFCGLEWNQECLNFHQSGREVKTASYHQVRQPIYTKSLEKWRHYDQFLGPLKEALGISNPN